MTLTSSRFWRGCWYGLLATIAMTVVMLALYAVGVLPEPIYLAQIARMLAIPLGDREVTMSAEVLSVPLHLAYGAFWGGLAALTTPQLTWWKGLFVGLGLWLIMMIFVLPFTGETAFEGVYDPAIWVSTLVMHFVYGATLGGLAGRHEPLEAHATSLG